MNRRSFLGAAAAAGLFAEPNQAGHDPEWTIDDIQGQIARGQLTSETLTRRYLHRIHSMNQRGPALRAVLEVNPDALVIARELDRERAEKGPRSPLHGVPVLLKDNIETGDRMQTTAGSLALLGAPRPFDAPLVTRLRQAGAVILGKTNLSEWANFRGTHSTSGWSARGGQTRNPYALDRNPCGSSSGSAVAVAAGFATIAIGTETDGSIVGPSSMNGIVGIKPTVGLLSQAGLIPISSSQDAAGPLAKNVRDAAVTLGILAGQDYAQACVPNGLRGVRIGVARQFMAHGYQVGRVIGSALDALERAGAILVDPVDITTLDDIGTAELTVMLYEFKAGVNDYLQKRGGAVKSLAGCIEFNRQHAAEELAYFGQDLMEEAQEKGPLTEKEYRRALTQCRRMRREGIDAVMTQHKLDAIVATTTGPAHLTDPISGDPEGSHTCSPAAIAGYPHITVPAGSVCDLPFGLSFFGTAWSEEKLIQYAYAFEQEIRARRPPQYLPTANLLA